MAIKHFFRYDTVFEKTIEYNSDSIVISLHIDAHAQIEFFESGRRYNYPYRKIKIIPLPNQEYTVQYIFDNDPITEKNISSIELLMQLLRQTFEKFMVVVHRGSVLDRLAAIEARQDALDELIQKLNRPRG